MYRIVFIDLLFVKNKEKNFISEKYHQLKC